MVDRLIARLLVGLQVPSLSVRAPLTCFAQGLRLVQRWTIGDADVIKRATLETVQRFIDNYYHLSRVDLQLVGDFAADDVTRVTSLIESTFGALSCGNTEAKVSMIVVLWMPTMW